LTGNEPTADGKNQGGKTKKQEGPLHKLVQAVTTPEDENGITKNT